MTRAQSLHIGLNSVNPRHYAGWSGELMACEADARDMAAYLASLERLLREPVRTIFPAHGSPQGGAHRRIRGLIAHRMERERKVRAALDATPRTPSELVPKAYDDTKQELWGYAERSLLAHLLKLEAEGAAVREGDRWRAP